MPSEKGKRKTVRFEDDFHDNVEAYGKLHNLTWNKALHARDRKNLQTIKEQKARIVELEQQQNSVFSYFKKNEKDLSSNQPLEGNMSIVKEIPNFASTQFSDITCNALGYNKKTGEFFCMDSKAPISTKARRNFNPQVCVFCQNERKKTPNQTQRIQKSRGTRNPISERTELPTPRNVEIICPKDGQKKNLGQCAVCEQAHHKDWILCQEGQQKGFVTVIEKDI